ncbi:MAG: PilZ domain-containing protein [Pseudomonadota bacterium]
MTRPVSGIFTRNDRVRAPRATSVRLLIADKRREFEATLVELSLSDFVLTEAVLPPLDTSVSVAITLSGRYLEFELPGVVSWHRGHEFGVSFEYLTARQMYGLALAIDVLGQAARLEEEAEPARTLKSSRS